MTKMTKNDKTRFVQIMLGMADNFRDSITKEGMSMRFDLLNPRQGKLCMPGNTPKCHR